MSQVPHWELNSHNTSKTKIQNTKHNKVNTSKASPTQSKSYISTTNVQKEKKRKIKREKGWNDHTMLGAKCT